MALETFKLKIEIIEYVGNLGFKGKNKTIPGFESSHGYIICVLKSFMCCIISLVKQRRHYRSKQKQKNTRRELYGDKVRRP